MTLYQRAMHNKNSFFWNTLMYSHAFTFRSTKNRVERKKKASFTFYEPSWEHWNELLSHDKWKTREKNRIWKREIICRRSRGSNRHFSSWIHKLLFISDVFFANVASQWRQQQQHYRDLCQSHFGSRSIHSLHCRAPRWTKNSKFSISKGF